jgi:protein-S-isoprenylcysteine O-methyltransferase Ste14
MPHALEFDLSITVPWVWAPLCLGVWLIFVWGGGILFIRELKGAVRRRQFVLALLLVVGTGSLLLNLAYQVVAHIWGFPIPTMGLSLLIRMGGFLFWGLGVAITGWSRLVLGTVWTTSLDPPPAEQLRMSGPYRFLRHPIYAGAIGVYAGLTLAQNDWIGLVVYAAHVFGYVMKTVVEDRLLDDSLGSAYGTYRQRVHWRLLPRIW